MKYQAKYNELSKFLRRSLLTFIIKVFRTIVFIFIVISTTFRPICPPAFFRCLSNSGTFTELWTTSFIETTGVESEQATPVVSIKDVVRSSLKVPEFDKHLKKAGGHIGRKVVEITIKTKTIVRKTLIIKIQWVELDESLLPTSKAELYGEKNYAELKKGKRHFKKLSLFSKSYFLIFYFSW